MPALVFGVAFGNVLQGVPFRFDDTLRMTYSGTLLGLFNPFALLCGLVSVAMLAMHGGAWLACKTEGALRRRAQRAACVAALVAGRCCSPAAGSGRSGSTATHRSAIGRVDRPLQPAGQAGARGRPARCWRTTAAFPWRWRRRCSASPGWPRRLLLRAAARCACWRSSPAGSASPG